MHEPSNHKKSAVAGCEKEPLIDLSEAALGIGSECFPPEQLRLMRKMGCGDHIHAPLRVEDTTFRYFGSEEGEK